MNLPYTTRLNRRAKHLRITIYPPDKIVVTLPRPTSDAVIEKFLYEKQAWIEKQIAYFKNRKVAAMPYDDKKSFRAYKDAALELVTKKVETFNKLYGFSVTGIKIRNTKTQWGSCSRQGVLSFNYRIVFLTERLRDYLIVHEICHLREFNHSPRFWALVELAIPDYKAIRKQLRQEGFTLH